MIRCTARRFASAGGFNCLEQRIARRPPDHFWVHPCAWTGWRGLGPRSRVSSFSSSRRAAGNGFGSAPARRCIRLPENGIRRSPLITGLDKNHGGRLTIPSLSILRLASPGAETKRSAAAVLQSRMSGGGWVPMNLVGSSRSAGRFVVHAGPSRNVNAVKIINNRATEFVSVGRASKNGLFDDFCPSVFLRSRVNGKSLRSCHGVDSNCRA